jgi:hypothetical protein
MQTLSTQGFRADYMCRECREQLTCSKCRKLAKRLLYRGSRSAFVGSCCRKRTCSKLHCSTRESAHGYTGPGFLCRQHFRKSKTPITVGSIGMTGQPTGLVRVYPAGFVRVHHQHSTGFVHVYNPQHSTGRVRNPGVDFGVLQWKR